MHYTTNRTPEFTQKFAFGKVPEFEDNNSFRGFESMQIPLKSTLPRDGAWQGKPKGDTRHVETEQGTADEEDWLVSEEVNRKNALDDLPSDDFNLED